MESNNNQVPMPETPNGEQVSDMEEAPLSLEEVTTEAFDRPNNQLITYHRRFPDGKYIPVYLSKGFGFNAEDEELIQYLNKRIEVANATCTFIPTVNVYQHSPAELTELHPSVGVDDWYFFSSRDRKYLNGDRPNRAAGNGYWKATGADKKIYHNDEQIGSKKCLVFYEGRPPRGDKTRWVMLEYVAFQPQKKPRGPDVMRLDDCVLCRIYKASDRPPKREKQTAAPEFDPLLDIEVQQPSSPMPLQTIPVQQPSSPMPLLTFPVQQPSSPMPLQTIPVQQPSSPMPLLTFPVQQPNLENLQLLQPNTPTPQQNLQVLQPNPTTFTLLQLNHFPWQNSEAIQYSFDCQSESILEDTTQIHFGNLENSHEYFSDSMNMAGDLTNSTAFGYTQFLDQSPNHPIPDQALNYYNPYPSMGRFDPDTLFDNTENPQGGL